MSVTQLKNKITEAVILAGGLGTRLRTAVSDVPKCMAPVAGRPFLYYVIRHLRMQGIQKIIFSLGYMHEVIEAWLAKDFPFLNYAVCIEEEPLGTGGAIQLALQHASSEEVLVTNGDTLYNIILQPIADLHYSSQSACTLALKPMQNFDRYGVVHINEKNLITAFNEKQFYKDGLINGGTYLINKAAFLLNNFSKKFSFEKDYLEKYVHDDKFFGLAQDVYFIDIGIPEDFARAQNEFTKPELDLDIIDKNWTLFLDRDGVINEDKPGSYVFTADEFDFVDGAPQLFKKLTEKFKRIIIITNQRGVGRGLIKPEDLDAMHQKMLTGIEQAGGHVDKIYFATDTDNKAFNRKPNPGMALQVLRDFPDTDFNKSIMVGNSITDMQFGRSAGMYTVFVTTTNKSITQPNADIDAVFDGLKAFSEAL